MPYVRWLEEIGTGDTNWAGEKAAALGELIHAGFEVPRGFCVDALAYQETLESSAILERIVARLAEIDIGDPTQLEPTAEEIRGWIEHVALPAQLEQEIQAAIDAIKTPSFAVRASRVTQDVPDPASSGLPQAYLALTPIAISDAIRSCWATPWNSRAIYFRNRKKIPQDKVSVAAIVQSMINPEAGGMLLTASLLDGKTNLVQIDATWGLGQAVGAARWKPDHFSVDKSTGAIQERIVATQTVMDVATPEEGVHTIGVPEEKQQAPALSDSQVAALAEIAGKVEALFQGPQELEWCRVGDKIYLLQTSSMKK